MTLYQDHYLKRLRVPDTTDKWFWLNNEDRIVEHISYFKLQAKNLLRDYKSRTSYVDKSTGAVVLCQYAPKFFDIDGIFLDYDWPDADFSLMKAQHFIALMVGFRKWTDLLNASVAELELARLLFENQHKIDLESWNMYVRKAEYLNDVVFDTEDRLAIFREVFLNVDGHESLFCSYRLNLAV